VHPAVLFGFEVSLLGGWFPSLVKLAVPLAFGTALGWRTSRWRRRTVPALAVATAALTVSVGVWLASAHAFPGSFPWSFYPLGALPVYATAVAVVGWHSAPWWRRGIAISTVPLSLLLAGVTINAYFGYYPTVGAAYDEVTGRGVPGQLDLAQLPAGRSPAGPAGTPPAQYENGRIVTLDIPATVSGFAHRDELVYLPPAWFFSPRPTLPVIEMVGAFGTPASWIRAGHAAVTADAYAATHHGEAPILVFVDQLGSFLNDTECVDGPKGNSELHLTVDVRQYLIRDLGVSADPAAWGVVGFSMGGTCALDLVLRHPDLFDVFGDIAGDVGPNIGNKASTVRRLYGGSEAAWAAHDPLTILAHRHYSGVAGVFLVGARDHGPKAVAWRLDHAALLAGIDTHVDEEPGTHTWPFAARAFADALPWLVSALASSHLA
jgi:S-formylglutathione hydrolase FrmB